MSAVLDRLIAYVRSEPVRTATLAASVVVFVAAKLGVVISEQSVLEALLLVLPILLGGQWARGNATPIVNQVPAAIPADEVSKP